MIRVRIRSVAILLGALCLCACGAIGEPPADTAVSTGLRIGAVQGNGARSPLEGQRVDLQGVVTGNFVSGLGGFFLQDPAGEEDGDENTSDGIFVVWPRGSEPVVRRGDRVRVAGMVAEHGNEGQSQTAIDATDVTALGRGAAAAVRIDQAPARVEDWERFEGMWLRIAVPLTVSGNDALLRHGEIQASFDGRQYQATERHPPGAQASVAQADNARRRLLLDDNRRGEFPDKLWFLPQGLSNAQPLRAGSVLHQVEGVLEQRHGWRLQLTAALDRIDHAPRPDVPALPEGVRVASFNLLNYFNGDGRGRGFPTARGASNAQELVRQRDKLVAAIAALQPDIAALMELENDGYGDRSSIAELVDALNRLPGPATYRIVSTGEGPGSDQIRVGMIFRADRITPRGTPATLDTGAFAHHNRVPLVQTFVPAAGGEPFAVVANHFKSKGSCDEAQDQADRDAQDGQGCWNATRRAAAMELAEWIRRDPATTGNRRYLLLGDLNSYAQEDPIRVLRDAGWRDAFEVVGAKRPHSYVWNGYAGRLDHAFSSPELAPYVIAAIDWHINADESEAFDYNRENRQPAWFAPDAYRASDHDPLLVVLDFRRR